MAIPEAAHDIADVCATGLEAVAEYIRCISGDDANGDTSVTWGTIISGNCFYKYVDGDGVESREDAKFTFSTNAKSDFILMQGEHVSVYTVAKNSSGTTAPYIHYNFSYAVNTAPYTWLGGDYYYALCNVNGHLTGTNYNGAAVGRPNESQWIPKYYANGAYSFATLQNGVVIAFQYVDTVFSTSSNDSARAYAKVSMPQIEGQNLSYNQIVSDYMLDWANQEASEQGIDYQFTVDDMPSWWEAIGETEPTEAETGGSGCGCSCTTIYVNADGSLTLQNEISGDYNLNIDNNADISLNIAAAAGAFGAGAVVIDPDAEINVTAGAGAFGAGAFGAGAIVSPDVDISGDLSVGDISGEINLQASEVNFNVSGGDVNIDQSGATNNNNTTNNYYYTYDPSEPEFEQESFSIDYDEILSEGELESILNQETYELAEIQTDAPVLVLESIPVPEFPVEMVQAVPEIYNAGISFLSDVGLLSPFLAVSVICFFIRSFRR